MKEINFSGLLEDLCQKEKNLIEKETKTDSPKFILINHFFVRMLAQLDSKYGRQDFPENCRDFRVFTDCFFKEVKVTLLENCIEALSEVTDSSSNIFTYQDNFTFRMLVEFEGAKFLILPIDYSLDHCFYSKHILFCSKQDYYKYVSLYRKYKEYLRISSHTKKGLVWDDVVVTSTIKKLFIDDFAFFINNYDWYKSQGLSYKRGYLLYGPPGNGKTFLIKILLEQYPQLNIHKFDLNSPEATNSDLDSFFDCARENPPALIVFEDLDRIFALEKQNRISLDRLLNNIDGIDENEGIIVIATANNPKIIEPALKRPGRFDRVLEIPNPEYEQRLRYLKLRLSKLKNTHINEDIIKNLAEKTEGLSMVFLKNLIETSASLAFARDNNNLVIIGQDLLNALSHLQMTSKNSQNKQRVGFIKCNEPDRELNPLLVSDIPVSDQNTSSCNKNNYPNLNFKKGSESNEIKGYKLDRYISPDNSRINTDRNIFNSEEFNNNIEKIDSKEKLKENAHILNDYILCEDSPLRGNNMKEISKQPISQPEPLKFKIK